MPLSQDDANRLYSDAFARTTKAMWGEQAFTVADLKTQLDVAHMVSSVMQDELTAAQTELAAVKAERDRLVTEVIKGAALDQAVDPIV